MYVNNSQSGTLGGVHRREREREREMIEYIVFVNPTHYYCFTVSIIIQNSSLRSFDSESWSLSHLKNILNNRDKILYVLLLNPLYILLVCFTLEI